MDITELLAFIAVLATIESAAVEWLKNLLAASTWDDAWSEEAHAALVQAFAFAVGVAIAFVAQLDIVHALYPASAINTNVAIALSGLALALPADGLKTALEWIKAIRDAKQAQAAPAEPPQPDRG